MHGVFDRHDTNTSAPTQSMHVNATCLPRMCSESNVLVSNSHVFAGEGRKRSRTPSRYSQATQHYLGDSDSQESQAFGSAKASAAQPRELDASTPLEQSVASVIVVTSTPPPTNQRPQGFNRATPQVNKGKPAVTKEPTDVKKEPTEVKEERTQIKEEDGSA